MRIGSSFVIDIKSDDTQKATRVLTSNLVAKSTNQAKADDFTNYGGTSHCVISDDGVFDKPIIIVQGFDPIGEINFNSQFRKYAPFQSDLNTANYALVFIILKNTNLSLQDNTDILKDFIAQINITKVGDFESILIGESMGGLLSRMALKQLENENYDHEVGLYLSFDAPHQGVNLPPGLQYLFKDVLDSRLAEGFVAALPFIDNVVIGLTNLIISPFTDSKIPDLRDVLEVEIAYNALSALNSEAAKSMLVRHIEPDGLFNESQNTLQNLGYPNKTRNIALINGSNESSDLGNTLAPGAILIDYPLWEKECNEFSLRAWSSPTNSYSRVSNIKWKIGAKVVPVIEIRWENKCVLRLFGKCVIETKVPVKVTVDFKCASTNLIDKDQHYNFNGASYDNATGSILPNLEDNLPFALEANTTFVPTASAIDLSEDAYNSSTDPNGLTAVTNATVLDNFIINNQTPFDEIYSKDNNSIHVHFSDNEDEDNFDAIIVDEFMFENLEIQNKNIVNDRDFDANSTITIGNDVNSITRKNIVTGNVTIDNNANVNFTANSRITLNSGTHFKQGSTVNLKVSNNNTKAKTEVVNTDFQIKIIGANEYTVGKSPSFKVLSSDLDSEYNYDWVLQGDTGINSTNNEFIIDDFLYPGTYSIKVTATSRESRTTKSLTKTFKVNADLNSYSKKSTDLANVTTTVSIYPNPVVDNVTIIAQKEIFAVTIYDISSKIISQTSNVNKTWQSLDLENLPSGIYIIAVHYSDNSTPTQKKLIKK